MGEMNRVRRRLSTLGSVENCAVVWKMKQVSRYTEEGSAIKRVGVFQLFIPRPEKLHPRILRRFFYDPTACSRKTSFAPFPATVYYMRT